MSHGIRLPRRLEQSSAGSEEGGAMKKSGLSVALGPVSARASPRPRWHSHLRTRASFSLLTVQKASEALGLSESDGLQGQSWAELNPRSQFNVFLLFIKTKSEFVKLLVKINYLFSFWCISSHSHSLKLLEFYSHIFPFQWLRIQCLWSTYFLPGTGPHCLCSYQL